MATIGFHASHEQISPRQLLADVQRAEQVGFNAAMCSDHFEPWSPKQGHSGYAWSWLGAALATTNLGFGVVNAPGQRYHPAIIAQAIGTLGVMFPGRFWAALGSGEYSNEHVTGAEWPRKEDRQKRLEECVDVIKRMLGGETVSHQGMVEVDQARLWDVPDPTPELIAPAVSVLTAARGARWADGLATINADHNKLREILDAWNEAGGPPKRILQLHLSWAPTEAEAYDIALDQWASNVLAPPACWDLTATHFGAISELVTSEHVAQSVQISADPGVHAEKINEYFELGFDAIYLHYVGQEQTRYLETFGERVLPQFVNS